MVVDHLKASSGEILRVGIVGLGKMGLLHACTLSVLPDVEVVALCDKNATIRKILKKAFSRAQLTDDVKKLASVGLDAVYITTPIPSHYYISSALYSEKITQNLFVEKTLASNYGEAKELCKLAQSFGGANMVGYMKRFSVTFRKAKDILNAGTLGQTDSFEAYAYSSDFAEAKGGSNTSGLRGGVLRDLGSHVADLALWFFGDLTVESADLQSRVVPGSEDVASFKVKGMDGLKGQFDMSWCKSDYRMPEFGLIVRGSNGVLRVNDDEVKLELSNDRLQQWFRHDLNDKVGFLIGSPEYFLEDEHFIKVVRADSKAEPDFETASRVDSLLDEVEHRADKDG
jgi:predicted dehydrogenase